MKIKLITVGNKMPSWVNEGYNEYAQRMGAECRVDLIEIDMPKRSKNSDIERLKIQEAELISHYIKNDCIVALDVLGQSWSTEQLAKSLQRWQHDGRDVALLIGGPDGLASSLLQRAEQKWSLSALTLPHPLVRIVVAEALYRAHTVNINHPYHRA
jgi:23S rRNA (pseudouridine1915-N3)-methyltransferase